MARRNGSSAAGVAGTPSAEAREALALWGLALRYASAAVAPVAKGAAHSVKERLSTATSGDGSLKERLDPSKTEKGGKIGDAADALLEKMGPPGKLAAKASLGSRVIDRITPDHDGGHEDDQVEADLPKTEEEEEAVLEEHQAQRTEPEAGEEPAGPSSEGEEDEVAEQAEAEEPKQSHEGAAPLHTDFDHAYSGEVENYEHQDAYATPR